MRLSTIKKYTQILTECKNRHLSIAEYCSEIGMNPYNVHTTIHNLKKQNEIESELVQNLLNLYAEVTGTCSEPTIDTIDNGEETKSEVSYERNDENKIVSYRYKIYKKDKPVLDGRLTREEMYTVYRLYTWYGDGLTAKTVSRHFPELSLPDFKRILKAFQIYKDNCPFPPHMMEEKTELELSEIQLREKENSFLRRAEEEQIKNDRKLLQKYAAENIKLKKLIEENSNITITVPQDIKPVKLPALEDINQDINIYLSDFHLGSYTITGSLYDENRQYGFDEAKRRLTEFLKRLSTLGGFDTINLILMGDMIDCSGFTGMTSRMDHIMPNNMDPKEQANKYIELMDWFISSIIDSEMASKIKIYAVPEGNHDGSFGYITTKALLCYINAKYPEISTTMWEKYYGKIEHKGHSFYVMHGKDGLFMKKGMPLELNDKTKVMLYEWLMEQGETNENVHFVKGDLHSESFSSCKRLTYRNVLSLYGASDYSNMNYSRNSYGISYDLFIGNNLVRGTCENL